MVDAELPPQDSSASSSADVPATSRPAARRGSTGLPGSLTEYRRRRDFTRTDEPVGKDETALDLSRPVFAVHKHAASTLHYDLRLEVGGVLKSWAVPKGPSLDPADKRLAVLVEDHPLDYATFEGTIPQGEYGGGTVMLWDLGWWEPAPDQTVDPETALASGELKLTLHGQKLTGGWTLVQMKNRGPKNWLLLKHRDEAARPGSKITEEAPHSVLTGRSLEEIAQGTSHGA